MAGLSQGGGMKKKSLLLQCVTLPLLILLSSPVPAGAAAEEGRSTGSPSRMMIQLLAPDTESITISKRPEVRCRINAPFSAGGLLVLLDGTDITGMLDIDARGFSYRPLQVLPPGEHNLSITVTTTDRKELQQTFTFSTRHTAEFEEAYSENNLSLIYESVLEKPDDLTYTPHSRFDANLQSTARLKEGPWAASFTTNIRFLDRSIPIPPPEKKGLNLSNYLFRLKYEKQPFEIGADIGDIQLNETLNTVQFLARRGGTLYLKYKGFRINSFVVHSSQVFGFREGMGLEGTSDDHIMGVSLEKQFTAGNLRMKGVYVTGGEKGSSFGIYSPGNRKGEVLGVLLSGDLIEQKLNAEAEVDFSRFDTDTSDEFSPEHDTAWRVKLGGYAGNFSYSGTYEYVGADYEVIGNQGFQKDRTGFSLNGGITFNQIHSINVSYSVFHDNVEGDDLYPTIYTYQGSLNYSFNGIPGLPISLGYQRGVSDSRDEPGPDYLVHNETDTFSASISYARGRWNLAFQGSHSIQNDRTGGGNDSTTTTLTFTPSYFSDNFSVTPNFSFNRSRFPNNHLRTDTYTVNLDIRGRTYHQRVSYELGGTYNRVKARDGSSEIDTLNTNFRISYLLARNLWGYVNPSVGIRGLYNKSNDRVSSGENEELVLLLVLTADIPFSF